MPWRSHFRPMSEMNTTPLIDVLLVLLIMFIISIPPATHSVEVDLPTDCPGCRLPAFSEVSNKLTVDAADRLIWNGTAITPQVLAALLSRTAQMAIEPELQFEPAARASYEISARTLNQIKANGVTRFGFVGNERYRQF